MWIIRPSFGSWGALVQFIKKGTIHDDGYQLSKIGHDQDESSKYLHAILVWGVIMQRAKVIVSAL